MHENFNDFVNDIALLQLGELNIHSNLSYINILEERVDLSRYSPVCLCNIGESFTGQMGFVYGKLCNT